MNRNRKPSPILRTAKDDLRKVPSVITAFFCVSVVSMNLLANKTIYQSDLLALDGGFLISWVAFLCMDIVTKAFGQRTATTLSVFALLTNLLACLVFYLVSIIPSPADDYSKFNEIFGGTWFILLSSSTAFLASAVLNNWLNVMIGRSFRKKPDGMAAYAARSYISTFIGQFADNLIFAMLTFMVFAPVFWDGFRWTLTQCLTCSLMGAVLELAMEVLFSPLGYMVLKRWKREGICVPEKEAVAS